MSRVLLGAIAVGVLAIGLVIGVLAANLAQSGNPGLVAGPGGSPTAIAPTTAPATSTPGNAPTDGPTVGPTEAPTPVPTPTEVPTPTPVPTPAPVAAPLTGRLVKPEVAARKVVAVMVDDLWAARPQSGLSDASVVWHAPAEGGIPRYMALFSEGNPPSVGPVRSTRLYYVAWAAEWNSVLVHVGGSPQAVALLRGPKGKGSVVWDADQVRWGGPMIYRVKFRRAPHNVYSDAKNLRRLAARVGAKPMKDPKPVWQFAPDAPLELRPAGGRIVVPYPANTITYTYDRKTNTYPRTVSREGKQFDAGPKPKVRIAPRNVVVMLVPFVPIGDRKHRLDGQVVGEGPAWISTNGTTFKGIWRKKSFAAPTRFFRADGTPVTLTVGQTFIQVVPRRTKVTVKHGTLPPTASPSPSAAPQA